MSTTLTLCVSVQRNTSYLDLFSLSGGEGGGEADSSVGRASDQQPRGPGFESARGKICTALFIGAPVFKIALVVEKDVKP